MRPPGRPRPNIVQKWECKGAAFGHGQSHPSIFNLLTASKVLYTLATDSAVRLPGSGQHGELYCWAGRVEIESSILDNGRICRNAICPQTSYSEDERAIVIP